MSPAPLPFGNAVSRWYYVLYKGLIERGHDVKAFAACTSAEEAKAARDLFPTLVCGQWAQRGFLESKIEALHRPHSYMVSPELQQELEAELARGFDIFHMEALWCGWAGLAYRHRALLSLHYLFQIDRAGEQPASLMERARMLRSHQSEDYLIRQYPLITTVSSRLTEHVKQINPGAEVHTIPLGFDLSKYPFELNQSSGPPVVTLIGSYDWRPSYSAGKRLLDKLWPAIHDQVPEARLQVVGRRAKEKFSEYQNMPDVTFYQDVPDTVPYFREATVMLYAPGRGSGTKVKCLESFALGLPVVTTSEGMEGIPGVDGVHAGVSEDDMGLIDRTIRLLRDPEDRIRQAQTARKLVEEHFQPPAVLDRLEEIYQRALVRRQQATNVA